MSRVSLLIEQVKLVSKFVLEGYIEKINLVTRKQRRVCILAERLEITSIDSGKQFGSIFLTINIQKIIDI